jgi:hypothetical protein
MSYSLLFPIQSSFLCKWYQNIASKRPKMDVNERTRLFSFRDRDRVWFFSIIVLTITVTLYYPYKRHVTMVNKISYLYFPAID